MLELLIEDFHDPRFMTMVLAAIAASATVYTLVAPFFAAEGLTGRKRMKAVGSERERIRQRERERLAKSEKVSLRQAPKQFVSRIVEDLNLGKWVAQESAREKLVMAGYRGQAPYVTFLFFRMVTPIVMLIGAIVYVFSAVTHAEVHPDQGRHLHRRRVFRLAGANAVFEKRHYQASALDQASFS